MELAVGVVRTASEGDLMRLERVAGLVLIIALFQLGCGSADGSAAPESDTGIPPVEEEKPGIAVEAVAASSRNMSNLYSTSATLRADRLATVVARTSGVIQRLLVEEGDRVLEGQELAFLEDDEQRIEFERADTTYRTKKIEYERSMALHEQGLVSEEEFDTRRRESEEARQTASLQELELRRTRIKAPFAGTIVLRYLDPGANVVSGNPVFDLADLDPLYADVDIPERQVGRLQAGQQVRLLAGEATEFVEARIERIAPVVDTESGTVKVTVSVQRRKGLRPGGFVRLQIVTDTHDNAIVVPRSALVAEGHRWHLYRILEDGKTVERVSIERKYEEDDWVEVMLLGEGTPIQEGDRVVTVGAPALTDGALVETSRVGS